MCSWHHNKYKSREEIFFLFIIFSPTVRLLSDGHCMIKGPGRRGRGKRERGNRVERGGMEGFPSLGSVSAPSPRPWSKSRKSSERRRRRQSGWRRAVLQPAALIIGAGVAVCERGLSCVGRRRVTGWRRDAAGPGALTHVPFAQVGCRLRGGGRWGRRRRRLRGVPAAVGRGRDQ